MSDKNRSVGLVVPPKHRSVNKTPSRLSLHGRERSVSYIEVDLPRTFPQLAFFSQGGALHEQLRDVLEAYCFFRPDCGYVQGMSYPVVQGKY